MTNVIISETFKNHFPANMDLYIIYTYKKTVRYLPSNKNLEIRRKKTEKYLKINIILAR